MLRGAGDAAGLGDHEFPGDRAVNLHGRLALEELELTEPALFPRGDVAGEHEIGEVFVTEPAHLRGAGRLGHHRGRGEDAEIHIGKALGEQFLIRLGVAGEQEQRAHAADFGELHRHFDFALRLRGGGRINLVGFIFGLSGVAGLAIRGKAGRSKPQQGKEEQGCFHSEGAFMRASRWHFACQPMDRWGET